jgi:glycosyltransferase involved in cell wall biosynthesis
MGTNPTVLLIVDDFPPSVCGVGDYAAQLAKGLSEKGVEVTVLTKYQTGLPEHAPKLNFVVHPSIRHWSWSEIRVVLRELDTLPATTIVHIQYSSASNYNRRLMINFLPAVLRILRPKAHVVVTMHGFHEQRHRWRLRAMPMLLAPHRCILVHPKDYTLVTRGLVAKGRVAFVPISSNIPSIGASAEERLATRKSLGIAASDRVVVFFGEMRAEKGVLELIDAVSRSSNDVPTLKLILVGGLNVTVATTASYEQALLTAMQAAEMKGALIMVHNPEPLHVAQLLRTADLAIFPFRNGASGNRGSLLAAIINEVPVLTTDGISTPSGFAIDYGVETVPAGDIEALKNRMTDLLLHPTKLEVGRRRSSHAAGRLSWDAIIERHIELYRGLLEHPKLIR